MFTVIKWQEKIKTSLSEINFPCDSSYCSSKFFKQWYFICSVIVFKININFFCEIIKTFYWSFIMFISLLRTVVNINYQVIVDWRLNLQFLEKKHVENVLKIGWDKTLLNVLLLARILKFLFNHRQVIYRSVYRPVGG